MIFGKPIGRLKRWIGLERNVECLAGKREREREALGVGYKAVPEYLSI